MRANSFFEEYPGLTSKKSSMIEISSTSVAPVINNSNLSNIVQGNSPSSNKQISLIHTGFAPSMIYDLVLYQYFSQNSFNNVIDGIFAMALHLLLNFQWNGITEYSHQLSSGAIKMTEGISNKKSSTRKKASTDPLAMLMKACSGSKSFLLAASK